MHKVSNSKFAKNCFSLSLIKNKHLVKAKEKKPLQNAYLKDEVEKFSPDTQTNNRENKGN